MEYFTKEALELLIENRQRDSKAFYEASKPAIERLVRQPMFKLIEEVVPVLQKCDSEIILAPKRQVSRIRRDTRFTKDKSLYRAGMWVWMGRDKRAWPGYPSFFFEICAEYAWWGCGVGFYEDEPLRESYRKMVLERDPLFMKVKEFCDGQKRFSIGEPDFKRTKYPNEPKDIQPWLDRKSIYMTHTESDPAAAFGEKLIPTVKRDLKKLFDMYRLCVAAYERRVLPDTVRPWSPHTVAREDEW